MTLKFCTNLVALTIAVKAVANAVTNVITTAHAVRKILSPGVDFIAIFFALATCWHWPLSLMPRAAS